MKNTKNANKGFTIIEVLIVLAIAGLIMLVVFLAVPALQRNSRNTQRKSDVSNVLGAVGEYVANNGGKLPAGANVDFSAAFVGAVPRLGFYSETTQVKYTKFTAAQTTAATVPTGNDSIHVYNYMKCNAAGNGATTTGASARSVVALYHIEGSSADVAQCTET